MTKEQENAFVQGTQAITICDNPYWLEFPKPSKKGNEEERCARAFVDGYIQKLINQRPKC